MLDTPDTTTGQTLRQVLGDMKHHVTDRALFYCVDRGTARNNSSTTAVLITPEEHVSVAAPLAKVLAAYYTQQVASSTKDWFSETMVEAAEGIKFASNGLTFMSIHSSSSDVNVSPLEAAEGIKFASNGLTFTSEEDEWMDMMEDDIYGLPEVKPDTVFHVDISPTLLDEAARNRQRNPRTEDNTWDTLAGRSLYRTSTVARRVANGMDNTSTGTKRSAESILDRDQEDSSITGKSPKWKSRFKSTGIDSQEVISSRGPLSHEQCSWSVYRLMVRAKGDTMKLQLMTPTHCNRISDLFPPPSLAGRVRAKSMATKLCFSLSHQVASSQVTSYMQLRSQW